jgi:hypothetical protein
MLQWLRREQHNHKNKIGGRNVENQNVENQNVENQNVERSECRKYLLGWSERQKSER